MTMTNKQYKAAREEAEQVDELYTFEHWNGYSFYPNRYMTPEDQKDMRRAYKTEKECNKAYALEGFCGRALIIPKNGGDELVLRSYYTDVCSYDLQTGLFTKTWNGYSNTTLKHVNIFREFLGLSKLSKREWIELETV